MEPKPLMEASFEEITAILERSEADYKRKHPRAGTTPNFWQVPNAPVWVEIRKVRYAAIVLEWGVASSGDYDLCTLQLEQEMSLFDGTKQKRTWVHPKPIQSYKLRKRVG